MRSSSVRIRFLALVLLGTTALHAGAATRTPSASVPPLSRPARWFPAGPGEKRIAYEDLDGSERVITRGLRLLERSDGSIERAPDLLPLDGNLAAQALPDRLGGGFLFQAVVDGTTLLWRAPTWTAPLRPLVRLLFDAGAVVPGFDRLYVVSARTRGVVAVDPGTGEARGLGSLPAASAYGAMVFADPFTAAVEVDLRGVLVTFDAGASWHRTGLQATVPGVFEQGGALILGTTRGAYELRPNGELRRFEALRSASDEATDEPMDGERAAPERLLGGSPLEIAVLRGVPDGNESAVVAVNRNLARVRLADGRITELIPDVVPPGAECTGLLLGSGSGFLCGVDRGATELYEISSRSRRAPGPTLSLTRVLAFRSPRRVVSSGNGAVVVRGGCTDTPREAGTYCARSPRGELREVRVKGDLGAERVVALRDGRIAVVVPPRLGVAGAVTVVDLSGRMTRRPLEVRATDPEVRALAERGLWLEGFQEPEPGALSGWAASGSSFVGLRVGLDGIVRLGPAQEDVEHVLLSGMLAFLGTPDGVARESTDGGTTWSDVTVPDARATGDLMEPAGALRGCSRVGCASGPWLRVGWGSAEVDLRPAADPPGLEPDPARFVSWAMSCAPTGEAEGDGIVPARAAPPLRRHLGAPAPGKTPRPSGAGAFQSSAWRPFLGVPGPPRGDALGFDFGTEDQAVQIRGYAWGPADREWDREAMWLVRGVDRFVARGAIWSTRPSRAAWADPAHAASSFGSDPSHRVSTEWAAVLDPFEAGGVLVVRAGTETRAHVVEKDRAIRSVENSGDFPLDRPAGAVHVNGSWFLGVAPGARGLHLLRIDDRRMERVAALPRFADDPPPVVVRSVRGDGVGVWVIGQGHRGTRGGGDRWYVHPVDTARGRAEEPVVIPREALTHPPPPCSGDVEGWILPYLVSPSIARLDLGQTPPVPLKNVEARLVANPSGLCLDALAARSEGDPAGKRRAATAGARAQRSVPLVVTDRTRDHRTAFRCTAD